MKVLSRYPLANQIACVNFSSLCLETHMGKKTLIITFPPADERFFITICADTGLRNGDFL